MLEGLALSLYALRVAPHPAVVDPLEHAYVHSRTRVSDSLHQLLGVFRAGVIHPSLHIPPQKKIEWRQVRGTRWPHDWSAPTDPTPWIGL